MPAGPLGSAAADREPELEHDPRERMTPPTRAMPANGPAACAMPSVASGTPPNGNEKRSASTSECAAGRPSDAPAAGRRGERGETVERGEHAAGGEVAGSGQLPHPTHPQRQPAEARTQRRPRTGSRRRRGAEGHLEQRDPDERQRPPAPRRQGEGDRQTAASASASRLIDALTGRTSFKWTTMRWRAEPGGWQANSVAVCSSVWSTMWRRRARRPRSRRPSTRSGRPTATSRSPRRRRRARPCGGSPGCGWSRCPATTTLPTSPGIAVPGQWPGPRSSVASRMPSCSGRWTRSPGSRSCRARRAAPSSRPRRRGDRHRQRRPSRRWRSWSATGTVVVVVGAVVVWSASWLSSCVDASSAERRGAAVVVGRRRRHGVEHRHRWERPSDRRRVSRTARGRGDEHRRPAGADEDRRRSSASVPAAHLGQAASRPVSPRRGHARSARPGRRRPARRCRR